MRSFLSHLISLLHIYSHFVINHQCIDPFYPFILMNKTYLLYCPLAIHRYEGFLKTDLALTFKRIYCTKNSHPISLCLYLRWFF